MTKTMRDMPMLLSDREILQGEFEDFDSMTLEEFKLVMEVKVNMLLDLLCALGNEIERRSE